MEVVRGIWWNQISVFNQSLITLGRVEWSQWSIRKPGKRLFGEQWCQPLAQVRKQWQWDRGEVEASRRCTWETEILGCISQGWRRGKGHDCLLDFFCNNHQKRRPPLERGSPGVEARLGGRGEKQVNFIHVIHPVVSGKKLDVPVEPKKVAWLVLDWGTIGM